MMKKIFLQIGATRDGLNPYENVAQRLNYYTVLVESSEFIDYQSAFNEYNFNYILRVNDPADPQEIIDAYQCIGLSNMPTIVLPGFEAYNKSAYQLRNLLPGNPITKFFPLDKRAQRLALSRSKHPQPWFNYFKSLDIIPRTMPTALYPFIIKPVDSGGGLGVWLISSDHELENALQEFEKIANYGGRDFSGFLIEQYLDGQEYSLQGVVSENKPYALACCRKIIEREVKQGKPIGFRESGHVAFSSNCVPESFKQLMDCCCECFGYAEGAFHIDFIVFNDVPYFIEMGFRMSGMGVSTLVDNVSGMNWADISFQIEEGKHFSSFKYDVGNRAVGQLRIRNPHQLKAAEYLIRRYKNGTIKYSDPISETAHHSSLLFADLSRHSGVLGTLELHEKHHDRVIEQFTSIIHCTVPAPQEHLPCAE